MNDVEALNNLMKQIFGDDYYRRYFKDSCDNHCKNGECNCKEEKKENFTSQKYAGYKAENIMKDDQKVGVLLQFAVPKMTKDHIQVSTSGNYISVSCDTEIPFFGKLDTKIKIGFDVLPKNVQCSCKDGYLMIYVYKEIVKEEKNIINID